METRPSELVLWLWVLPRNQRPGAVKGLIACIPSLYPVYPARGGGAFDPHRRTNPTRRRAAGGGTIRHAGREDPRGRRRARARRAARAGAGGGGGAPPG